MDQNQKEMLVLGSCINYPDILLEAIAQLTTEDFVDDKNKLIYNVIIATYKKYSNTDLLNIYDVLSQNNKRELAGYIGDLSNNVLTKHNTVAVINALKSATKIRQIKQYAQEITKLIDGGKPLENILNYIQDGYNNIILDNNADNNITHVNEVLDNQIKQYETKSKNPDSITGLPTGLIDLDNRLYGLQNGQLIILAARPAMGKTTLALNIAEHIGVKQNKNVLIFSLEMSKEQLVDKLVGSMGNVPMDRLQTGKLTEQHWRQIASVAGQLAMSNIWIDDTAGLTIDKLCSKTKQFLQTKKVDLIVVDYLQLLGANGKDRYTQISDISRQLKILAKDCNCPVLSLAQLSRSVEQRPDKRPIMSDLRESGTIEQDADIVTMLYRDDYYNKDSREPNVAECIVVKNRLGKTGTTKLAWLGDISRFNNLYLQK